MLVIMQKSADTFICSGPYDNLLIFTSVLLSSTCFNDIKTDKNASGSYLHPGLCEARPLGQLLSSVYVGVVRPLEGFIQLLKLLRAERRAAAALFSAQCQSRFRFHVRIICHTTLFFYYYFFISMKT